MFQGRFLGIAPNVGDAFCFLVLTDPEGDGLNKLPQVLARSVIRRRFLRATPADSADPKLLQESGECATISFYMNDKRTVLQDPPTSTEECDNMDDIIPPPSEPCVASLPGTIDSDFDEPVNDGVYEVYGPPVKRPRLLTAPSDSATLDFPASLVQPRAADLEEQITVVPTTPPSMPTNPTIAPIPVSNEVPASSKPNPPDNACNVAPPSSVNTITAHPDDDRGVVGIPMAMAAMVTFW